VLAGGAAIMLMVSACGTRVSDQALTEAGSLGAPVVAQTELPAGAPAAAAGVTTTTPVGAAAPPSGATATVPGASASNVPAAPGAATPKPAAASGAKVQVAADAPCTQQLAPIAIGQVGAFSGFLEPMLGGFRPGLAAWAAEVNARGGVQCHPIRLAQRDDGSDPARTTAAIRDLVDRQKVVAMLAADVPITIGAYRAALTPAGIPTIGGDGVTPDWNADPLIFPAGVVSLTGYSGAIKAMVQATGLKKLGLITCVEASICGLIRDAIDDMAAKAGATVVSKQSVSLTQTDYTSQCQSLKNAGAQTMFLTVDSSAIQRIFKSCASIGWSPPSATTGIAISPSTAADPKVRAANVYLNSPTPPYFNLDLPTVQAFQGAMKKYAPGARIDQSAMNAYVAGKLFEAGLAKVAAQARSGAVTTKMILDGMYQIKNENLGGYSSVPLTFKPGPHPTGACYYVVRINEQGLADLSPGRPQCL
jgi:branched-chain amino acid transport system substrate-binding protein